MDKMKYKNTIHKIFLFLIVGTGQLWSQSTPESVTWIVDNLEKIGGNKITVYGNPALVKNKNGTVVRFNGIEDGIIVHTNPLDGASAFTIEVVFRPDTSSNPGNKEQRFVHIQNPGVDERRLLIELRLTDKNNWFLDTYVSSDSSNLTLYAEKFVHTVDGWYHAALVYKDGTARHYVNGVEEMAGPVKFMPIENGNVSIGMRMNHRSYFKGEIKFVRMTNWALRPDEFVER